MRGAEYSRQATHAPGSGAGTPRAFGQDKIHVGSPGNSAEGNIWCGNSPSRCLPTSRKQTNVEVRGGEGRRGEGRGGEGRGGEGRGGEGRL